MNFDQILPEFAFVPWAAQAKTIVVRDDNADIEFDTATTLTIARDTTDVNVVGNTVYGDVVVKPLADYLTIDVNYVGDDVQVTDAWWLNATFGTVGGEIEIEDSRHGRINSGSVESLDVEDSHDMSFNFNWIDDEVYVYDSSAITVQFDWADGIDVILDQVEGVAINAGTVTDSDIEVIDSNAVTIDIINADGTDIELDHVSNVDVTIKNGDVEAEITDSDSVNFQTGSGEDEIYIDDSFDFTINTASGSDYVAVHGGQGVVLAGSGADDLHLHGAVVAYNAGTGSDDVEVIGGKTIGNMVDGYTDTIRFDLWDGGRHDVIVDPYDHVQIDAGASGVWDAATIDAIDNGGEDGQIDLAGLHVTITESYAYYS